MGTRRQWLGRAFAAGAAGHGPGSAVWTFPSILLSAMIIAWAAEAAQFLISQGLALAILAWLQTIPEFAVEAVITWEAGKDPAKVHLVIANFTGSLRLFVGVGWPLIFLVTYLFNRRRGHPPVRMIPLEEEHAIEVTALAPPILYFLWVWWKGTLTLLDSGVLIVLYLSYLVLLNRVPPQPMERMEEIGAIPRAILRLPRRRRNAVIAGLFLAGGALLIAVAHPFLDSMLALAVSLGVSQFVFVQWVSPFLSEFPEKVSALNWARRTRGAPMGLMNMVSSSINQWTLLIGMLPLIYSASRGELSAIPFDDHQRVEILLTIAQSFLGMLLLANMRFHWYEAAGLFVLWAVQFVLPDIREEVTVVYAAWAAVEVARAIWAPRRLRAFRLFPGLLRGSR